jgi:hypothetical protein
MVTASAISIASSRAENNKYGVYLEGNGRYTLSNVVSSENNASNVEFSGSATVDMTNVRACYAGDDDIFNDGATVTSSSLTCDQAKVFVEGGGTSITCNNPCS